MELPGTTKLVEKIPGIESIEFVSSGGQKAVYKAVIDGHTVALKMVSIDRDEPDGIDVGADVYMAANRAHREVGILDQVDIPVLAKTGPIGLATVDIQGVDWIYFTEEWIEGVTLHDSIKQGPLQPIQVARLAVDLIDAVCWLAERDLVHRDIKPQNIIWSENRARYVLLDPGIALDLEGTSLTQLPAVVGTMAYLSPEQTDPFRRRRLDFRSDLFSTGIVLYEASVGEHPFMNVLTTPAQLLAGILATNPEPVIEKLPDFPIILSDFIARLLGKAPHLRFRSCNRVKSGVEAIAIELGLTT